MNYSAYRLNVKDYNESWCIRGRLLLNLFKINAGKNEFFETIDNGRKSEGSERPLLFQVLLLLIL